MPYNPNSDEARFGEWAQERADAILKEQGYYILAAHLAGNGRAALWVSDDGALVAMDTVDMRGGKAAMRDTKGKTQSTFTWTLGREQHGIDADLWDHYTEQCRVAGLDGVVAIVELNRETTRGAIVPSGELLLYELTVPVRHRARHEMAVAYGRGGMVYWNRDAYCEHYPLPKDSSD